jgi:hypothetical protein
LTYRKKVISSSSPEVWTFWDFVAVPGVTSPVEEWRLSLPEEAEKSFNGILKANRACKNHLHWLGIRRHFFLEGKSKEQRVWELCFQDSDGVQYRILGVFWPKHQRMQATLLIGCTHKEGVYDPPSCLQTAIDRRKLLANGGAHIRERKVRTDF